MDARGNAVQEKVQFFCNYHLTGGVYVKLYAVLVSEGQLRLFSVRRGVEVEQMNAQRTGKNMKKLVVAGLAALLSGCVAVRQNDGGESNVRPYIVKDKIHEKYAVGKDKVESSDAVNCLFWFIRWGSDATHIADVADCNRSTLMGRAKNGAYAIACDKAGCDVIVGTKYRITAWNFFLIFQRVKAELSGYPATLTGVEVMPADANTPVERINR